MLRLNRDYPLPSLKRVRRKTDYVFDVIACILIARLIGRLMDGGFLGITSGSLYGPDFYSYAVPFFVLVWAVYGAYGQYSRDMESVIGYRQVGVSGYLFGWRFFMTHLPELSEVDESLEAQGVLAEKSVYRALSDKKGYLTLRGRSRHAAREWLEMSYLPDINEKEREWIPRWVCWRILRDNSCG